MKTPKSAAMVVKVDELKNRALIYEGVRRNNISFKKRSRVCIWFARSANPWAINFILTVLIYNWQ